MLEDKAEHAYLQFFLGPRDLNITEVTVAYDFSYFGRKTSEFKWKYLQYHGLDNALIKFRIRLPQELRFTSSLLVTNPYGNKTDKTKSKFFFAEK